MLNSIVLIPATVVLVALAGLFSGAETGMYSLSRVRLRLGVEKKRLSFVTLGKAMSDSPGLLLSMLTGTNLAHYLATSLVTVLLLSRVAGEQTAELLATLITAPCLFVFSELIPKNIFYYRADSLMPVFAPFLFAFHKLLTWSGAVGALKGLSRLFVRLTSAPAAGKRVIPDAGSSYIKAILRETHEEEFLSTVQREIINRVAAIPTVRMRSVMTALNKVQTVDINTGSEALLNMLKKRPFTRLPVSEGTAANIVGFVNVYDCLGSGERFSELSGFTKPIRKLSCEVSVLDAINVMQKEKERIILITRRAYGGRERPIGIVTMKDLVEELLGELAEW